MFLPHCSSVHECTFKKTDKWTQDTYCWYTIIQKLTGIAVSWIGLKYVVLRSHFTSDVRHLFLYLRQVMEKLGYVNYAFIMFCYRWLNLFVVKVTVVRIILGTICYPGQDLTFIDLLICWCSWDSHSSPKYTWTEKKNMHKQDTTATKTTTNRYLHSPLGPWEFKLDLMDS